MRNEDAVTVAVKVVRGGWEGGGVGEAKNLNCLTHVGPDNRDIFHNGATP